MGRTSFLFHISLSCAANMAWGSGGYRWFLQRGSEVVFLGGHRSLAFQRVDRQNRDTCIITPIVFVSYVILRTSTILSTALTGMQPNSPWYFRYDFPCQLSLTIIIFFLSYLRYQSLQVSRWIPLSYDFFTFPCVILQQWIRAHFYGLKLWIIYAPPLRLLSAYSLLWMM